MILFVMITVLILLFALWLYMIMPSCGVSRRTAAKKLLGYDYAHRGLHSKDNNVPENSLTAFRLACEHGYGIELDVHITQDGQLVILHDSDLQRMCGVPGLVEDKTLEELSVLRLNNTDEKIPLFSQVLSLVNGRIPLIVEIKAPRKDLRVCQETYNMLCNYSGTYCVESFNPYAVRWFKQNAPHIIRGQLTEFTEPRKRPKGMFWTAHHLTNCFTRPDFIAFNCTSKKNFALRLIRDVFKPLMVSWTIRSQEVYDREEKVNDLLIFETFTPDHSHN